MERILYNCMVGACIFGCVVRILLARYYGTLLRALKCMKTTKNKWIQKMKEQFILRYQAMLGVQNVESFVEKFFSEQRLLGLPMSAWMGLHIQLVSFCLLLGAAYAMYSCANGASSEKVLTDMFQGIWTSALLLLVDGFCMIPAKTDAIKHSMQDYLENYLQVRLEHEYHVWGKDSEDLRQTRAVLDAQMQVIDIRAYKRQKAAMTKRRSKVEKKVREDVLRLKQEVESRRKLEAEAVAAAETERTVSRQVEEILQGLL